MAKKERKQPVSLLPVRPGGPLIERRGLPRRLSGDLFHAFLTASWPRLLITLTLGYFFINMLFAVLYLLGDGCIAGARKGSLADAFFFSVQTLATIGYGAMSPQGYYGHILVTIEAFFGLFMVAFGSGIMFTKFARPTSRIIFSSPVLFVTRDGKPSLIFRLGNERGNQIVEANMRVIYARNEVTVEGEKVRRFYDLVLVRAFSPLFVLSWTVVHVVDEASPLFGKTVEDFEADGAELICIVTGLDGTFAQTIHARHSYFPAAFRWGERFVDILGTKPDGQRFIDFSSFHTTEPDHPRNKG